jgi:hypothetical protein
VFTKNPVRNLPYLRPILILSSALCLGLPSGLFLFGFRTIITVCEFHISPTCATRPAHFVTHHSITATFGEEKDYDAPRCAGINKTKYVSDYQAAFSRNRVKTQRTNDTTHSECCLRIRSHLVNVIFTIQQSCAFLCPLSVESLRSHDILGLYLPPIQLPRLGCFPG